MSNVTEQLVPATVENTRSAVAKPTFIASAEKNIAEFIEQSTRHSVADASCEWTRTGTAEFDVVLAVSLDVATHNDDYTGRHHPDEHDVGTGTRDEYHATVNEAVGTERSRQETLSELVTHVAESGYGKIADAFVFRRHPRRIFYTYNCNNCGGKGHVTCHGCGGQRTTWQTCSSCGGRGYREQRRTVQRYTNSPPETVTDRYSCSCSGGRVLVNCSACRGSGTETCSSCSGHGCFTRVTSINVTATPSYSASYAPAVPTYVRDALERRTGLAKLLPDVATLHGEQIRQMGQEQKLATTYSISCPWAEGTVSAGKASANAEIFGKNGSIHSVGGLVEQLVEEDAAVLDGASAGPLFDRVLAAARSEAVARFMESEINQSIFELATKMANAKTEAGGPKRISEKLNHAVSEEYVSRAIVAMEATAARTFKAKSIFAVAVAIILSIPTLLLAAFALADKKSALVILGQRWLMSPGTSDLFTVFLYTAPLALTAYLMLRFTCRRWAKKCGGKVLVAYLAARVRFPAHPTALVLLFAAALPAVALTAKFGVRLDANGIPYGSRYLIPQPAPPTPPAKKNLQKNRSSPQYNAPAQ